MSKVAKVYFDANILIELAKLAVKKHRPDRENDLWFFQQMLKASYRDELELFTSSLTIAECIHVDSQYDKPTQEFYSNILLSGTMVTLVQTSVFVCEEARNLRWNHDIILKPIDSIHVASALDAKCSEFLSWDSDMTDPKQATKILALRGLGLAVIPPHKTSSLPMDYRQSQLDAPTSRPHPPTTIN
jgi:predicted nucleic acid-binding protein